MAVERPTMEDLNLPSPALDDTGQLRIWTPRMIILTVLFGLLLPLATLMVCSMTTHISCEPGAVEWMEDYLSECVYSYRDLINFGIGYLCMACWSLCLAPQIIVNYCLGKAEDQSFLFYLLWVAGDITNLLGCVIAKQLPTQIGVAVIYLALTVLLIFQYVYYNCVLMPDADDEAIPELESLANPKFIGSRTPTFLGSRTPTFSPKPVGNGESQRLKMRAPNFGGYGGTEMKVSSGNGNGNIISAPDLREKDQFSSFLGCLTSEATSASVIIVSFVLILTISLLPGVLDHHQIAFINGWAMTIYYTISRIPQIFLIVRTKQVAGLSPLMFVMTFMGNVTYILQVLSVSTDAAFLKDKIPWIVQAVLCIIQDLLVLMLYWCYHNHGQEKKIKDARNAIRDL